MTFVLFTVLAVCATVFVVLLVSRRRPNSDDAVASFRRHLDALSTESRQDVIDRVQSQPSITETEHGA